MLRSDFEHQQNYFHNLHQHQPGAAEEKSLPNSHVDGQVQQRSLKSMRDPKEISNTIAKCSSLGQLCDLILDSRDNLIMLKSHPTATALTKLAALANRNPDPTDVAKLPQALDLLVRHCTETDAGASMNDKGISWILKELATPSLIGPSAKHELKSSVTKLFSFFIRIIRDNKGGRLAHFIQEHGNEWKLALKVAGEPE